MRPFTVLQGNRKNCGKFFALTQRAIARIFSVSCEFNSSFRNEEPFSFNRAEVRIDDTAKYLFRVPFECEILFHLHLDQVHEIFLTRAWQG